MHISGFVILSTLLAQAFEILIGFYDLGSELLTIPFLPFVFGRLIFQAPRPLWPLGDDAMGPGFNGLLKGIDTTTGWTTHDEYLLWRVLYWRFFKSSVFLFFQTLGKFRS